MQIEHRFIGRDREVAQLERAIGPGTDGLRIAMLSGPSGLGKTTLAQVAADHAIARGFRVATVHGRAGALSTPFAPFNEAMPEFEALLSILAVGQSIDIEHAGIGLVNLIAELVVDQPLLLVFDDAQALDESSIALLPYLMGVSERCQLSLLFVEQTDAIGIPSSYRSFIDGILARRVVGHLELGPMAPDAVRDLVAHQLDLDDPTDVPQEIVERAGGNPWFAKELAGAWRRGETEVPTNIAAAATARLHSLDEVGQEIVQSIARCPEGAHIGWLESLSDQRPRQFVRTMEAIELSGLVREDGEIISIAHPLMQQALDAELSAAMRRAIHIELAEVIATVPMPDVVSARAQGYHLSQAGRSDAAVQQYLRAAESNEVNGQIHEAYADLQHAFAAESRSDQQITLLRRCALLATQLGLTTAIEHWTDLGRVAAATGDDEQYAYALYQQYWACNDGTANERLHRAASLGSDRLGWSARAAATIARMRGDYDAAITLDRRAIVIAEQIGDGLLEMLSLQKLASSLADLGQTAEALDTYQKAITRGTALRLHDWALLTWGDFVVTLLDDLRTHEAATEIDAAIRYAEDLGLERTMPALLAWKGYVTSQSGDLDVAMTHLERALVLDLQFESLNAFRSDHWGAFVRMLRTEVANDLGHSNAEQYLDEALAPINALGYASWSAHLDFQRARVAHRRTGIEAAVMSLEGFNAEGEASLTAEVASWLAHAGVVDGSAAAIDLARALRTAIDTQPNRYVELACAEVDAVLLLVDNGDIEPLQAVSRKWADAGRSLLALRAQVTAGASLLKQGRADLARPILDAARKGLNECGASADADRAASLLRQTGARSRAKSRTTNVGPLTKRELEIARLVAGGLRNSEVAGTLFLAEKTVAAHLSNIYGKVEVRSRVQLTAWIRENDPEFEASLQSAAG